MAKTIEKLQRPANFSTNKTLAGQLFQEMKELFPNNAVEYFVSYYDYYQPEAYVAKLTHIEKDASINEQIDRMSILQQDLYLKEKMLLLLQVYPAYMA